MKTKAEIEKEIGAFFCHACLASKPATEASPDPRYCQVCYDFLTKEAEMLPENKRPKWIPKPQRALKACEKQYHIPQVGGGIMSTLESKKFEVDIIHPPDATRTSVKRGPRHRPLPEDLINLLAGEGLGSKAIAARLKAEFGITVSYKTIQRVVSGQRVMV